MDALETLRWHVDMGCDECIADQPVDRFSMPVAPIANVSTASQVENSARALPASTKGADVKPVDVDSDIQIKTAMELAGAAVSIDELRTALEKFDGCALRKTATNLVLSDGPQDARLMFVGEAPGAEEDRQGLPFVGPSGQLLNDMLASIGIDRSDVLISNTVFWRPPGNRTPTTQESLICKPFIERLIEIVNPAVLICVGAPSAHSLLGQTQGISRLRGKWYSFQTVKMSHPIAATALFHPAYLLRTPIKKRDAWHDLRMIRRKLDESSS